MVQPILADGGYDLSVFQGAGRCWMDVMDAEDLNIRSNAKLICFFGGDLKSIPIR